METTNTNPENQISENQEQKEDDKKDKTLLIKKSFIYYNWCFTTFFNNLSYYIYF